MDDNQEVVESGSTPAEVIYSWKALEFSKEPSRPWTWYLLASVLWCGFVVYSVWTKNWVQTGLAAMLGFVVFLLSRIQPREFDHQITASSFVVGGKSYPIERYRSFAVIRSQSGDRLLLVPKQRLGLGLSLQLGGADVERVRALMLDRLPEETREEDLVDRMNRWLRF